MQTTTASDPSRRRKTACSIINVIYSERQKKLDRHLQPRRLRIPLSGTGRRIAGEICRLGAAQIRRGKRQSKERFVVCHRM